MKPHVTIIVPVYNGERTVKRCVESLLNQTYEGVRVIVVDDGSKDSTGKILQECVEQDKRLSVLSQANSGPYRARLNGLRFVETEYFAFVDADDYVEKTMFSQLVEVAEKYGADIVECNVDGVGPGPIPHCNRDEVLKHIAFPRLIGGRGTNVLWAKLYAIRCRDSVSVENLGARWWEDLILNLQLYSEAAKVVQIPDCLYHYDVTDQSSVRNFGDDRLAWFAEIAHVREDLLGAYGVSAADALAKRWIARNARNLLLSALRTKSLPLTRRLYLAFKVLQSYPCTLKAFLGHL